MHVIFVHGWSVRSTDTYGDLPRYLRQLADQGVSNLNVAEIFLGKYVSFEDTVRVDDIARAFDAAIRDDPVLRGCSGTGERFAVITHSTGAPVIRQWISRFYAGELARCPLSHLVMLAPANHGSALAQLGKSRIARMKGYFDGVEPGQRVLNWLELGSDESWTLNEQWLSMDLAASGIYQFVLQGQSIDRSMYDVLNSYTDETGSDGVVRVAAANMNFNFVRLKQVGENLNFERKHRTASSALAILPKLAHSGEDMGIIRSVKLETAAGHPTVIALLECLGVENAEEYESLTAEFFERSEAVQEAERSRRFNIGPFTRTFKTHRCSMLIFRIIDDTGLPVTDYDLKFTAGQDYDEYSLPAGFFVDRQRNQLNTGKLTYYLNYDALIDGLNGRLQNCFGLNITARPDQGLARYATATFKGTGDNIIQAIRPNETLMVEIVLTRNIDRQIFALTDNLNVPEEFSAEPSGRSFPGQPS